MRTDPQSRHRQIHSRLRRAFRLMLVHFGPQCWWPGETPFEVCVGAILTQNTAWTNVEKAIANLRQAGVIDSPAKLRALPRAELAKLIRPAGYYNVKTQRLRCFLDFLLRFDDDLDRMFKLPTPELRLLLQSVKGIGPETADSILLYAGGHESFVIDAYTRRMLERHGWGTEESAYDELKSLFETALPDLFEVRLPLRVKHPTGHLPGGMSRRSEQHSGRARLFNEYHALLVALGKHHCVSREPRCLNCPLRSLLPRNARPILA